ncbi:MAG: hypothetical protein ABFE07_19915 [Armatimonadia bacterium]
MIVPDLIGALAVTIMYTVLLIPVLGPGRTGWPQFLLYCLLLFLIVWAGAVWFRPLGPTIAGVPWLVMLGLGGIFALYLAALVDLPVRGPRRVTSHLTHPPTHHHETVHDLPASLTGLRADSPEDTVANTALITLGLLAFILIALLLAVILGNYALVGR